MINNKHAYIATEKEPFELFHKMVDFYRTSHYFRINCIVVVYSVCVYVTIIKFLECKIKVKNKKKTPATITHRKLSSHRKVTQLAIKSQTNEIPNLNKV